MTKSLPLAFVFTVSHRGKRSIILFQTFIVVGKVASQNLLKLFSKSLTSITLLLHIYIHVTKQKDRKLFREKLHMGSGLETFPKVKKIINGSFKECRTVRHSDTYI